MMNARHLAATGLCSLVVLVSCASGNNDRPEMEDGRGGPPGGGQQGMMQPLPIPDEAETYEGIFSMEDDIFPVLIEEDGIVWHLIIEYPFSEDLLPKEGRKILVQAVASEEYPDRLTICYLEVEGIAVEPELPDRGQNGGPPGGNSDGGEGAGGGPGM